MAFDFPASPTVGQDYTLNGVTYAWNGYAWVQATVLGAPTGYTKTEADAKFVDVAGDTMTGFLKIQNASPYLQLNMVSGGAISSGVASYTDNKPRWTMYLGNGAGEVGGNTGSDFEIGRYDDTGAYLASALRITRANGDIAVSGRIFPLANGIYDLGASAYRWRTIYTSDLDLNNGIGDWTIVEGENDLFLYNNKKNKVYKFALFEVDPSIAPPKRGE